MTWYRCYVRWRHGARRPSRILLVIGCLLLLLAMLLLGRLRAATQHAPAPAPLGQRKYERVRALVVPPRVDPRNQGRRKGEDAPLGGARPDSNLAPALPDVTPAGVRPEVAALYRLAEFTCLRSGEQLPRARVNDDYCDCADGTDEPGTAACANGVFHCRGRDLPASRVGDGVCDCCDGSDEAGVGRPAFWLPEDVQRRLGHRQAPCPDTC
ncbi:SCO-spondin-like [Pollicipes pollicipes]|uniref:SCO-spondin-like n=1 Tax=Pollicipes pollicipes TaxID=41117 RepID=UPI00188564C4|nr:SCO-spondin-like [Pollicipes pollicipes]XP_037069685.1 SCO-spondin-like [Pollicipes pollicipes]XP_037069686.1 SCO-spondin-like [Pollicipes pollicipes]